MKQIFQMSYCSRAWLMNVQRVELHYICSAFWNPNFSFLSDFDSESCGSLFLLIFYTPFQGLCHSQPLTQISLEQHLFLKTSNLRFWKPRSTNSLDWTLVLLKWSEEFWIWHISSCTLPRKLDHQGHHYSKNCVIKCLNNYFALTGELLFWLKLWPLKGIFSLSPSSNILLLDSLSHDWGLILTWKFRNRDVTPLMLILDLDWLGKQIILRFINFFLWWASNPFWVWTVHWTDRYTSEGGNISRLRFTLTMSREPLWLPDLMFGSIL